MKAKKVLVIGGTGHIGSYLVPLLVSRNYEVTVFSRGTTRPYPGSIVWKKINQIKIDRERDEKNGNWQERIKDLEPDIIVDLICFDPNSAQIMAEIIDQVDIHLLTCGTAWIYGKTCIIPTPETAPRNPQNDYAQKKVDIEKILLSYTHEGHIQATLIHPTHITGPGKPFITPFGDNNLKTLQDIMNGKEIYLLDGGFSTLHHVHPADIAFLFLRCIEEKDYTIGECFNCGATHAMTFFGLGRYLAQLMNVEFRFQNISIEEYTENFGYPTMAADHVRQGCCVSMSKSLEMLNFSPRYSPEDAVREALNDLILQKKLSWGKTNEHLQRL
ncbi:MAG: NAD-dependent epimerase/dehydratase family protein [Candidatus Atribacteria bacterium]|nr:NAD-dependent epimerase/dehydratase family protein [Candidatus Atribacteria bacterium]